MPPGEGFPPTRRAALERIAAVRPQAYARSRNALDGAVSRLSPYITHGIVSLPEVLSGVARHAPGLSPQHKFVYELGWREYFRHVWQQRGDAILESLHAGPLPEEAYATGLPGDIRAGCTGVPVIDQAVRALYATGYLHNHARMWLASYVVHVRRVHWRAGADWMVAHLLDGDLASNHLSWQWVAGTASHKPYLFNAENVARHAPPDWHSPGTVIDASYAELDALAHGRSGGRAATPACEGTPVPVAEPELLIAPPDAQRMRPDTVSPDAEVWLVHPWSLGELPAAVLERGARPGGVPGVVGLLPAAHHARWPWSAARWHLVATRMQELTSTIWYATPEELEVALQPARSVATVDDPHIAAHLPEWVHRLPPPRLFATVPRPCASFSAWWSRTLKGVDTLVDLPGMHSLENQT